MDYKKIWDWILAGRLGEKTTWIGVAILVTSFYSLIGKPLDVTPDQLVALITDPASLVAPFINGIISLILVFKRENKPPVE